MRRPARTLLLKESARSAVLPSEDVARVCAIEPIEEPVVAKRQLTVPAHPRAPERLDSSGSARNFCKVWLARRCRRTELVLVHAQLSRSMVPGDVEH